VFAPCACLLLTLFGLGHPANGGSGNAAINAGGRYVAFASSASNLVAGDTNRVYDVFVRDRRRETTQRVSVGAHGAQANAQTGLAGISGSGRYVVMWSDASNLVAGDTNHVADVFVRDRVDRRTMRVSVGAGGGQLDSESGQAAISADGRYVAFASAGNVFVHDLIRNRTDVIAHGTEPALSADGRFVAFNNGAGAVVVRDRDTGATDAVSESTDGRALNGVASTPTISGNGRFVAFVTYPTLPLSPGDVDSLYVRDRFERTTTLVQRSVGNPSISADGLSVVYQGGRRGGLQEVIVRSLPSGTTRRISVGVHGTAGNGPSFTGVEPLSANGRYVAFESEASNLVPGDTDHAADVFVRDIRRGVTTLISSGR
jgi:Tol biopolymer transport system component